jgi:hypothetical protein
MFAEGLVDEVRALHAGPRPPGPVAAQGVGYREVLEFLEGRAPLEATVARVQARTRQFAKRQATWFRGLVEVRPWPVDPDEPPEATAARLAARITEGSGPPGAVSLATPGRPSLQPAPPTHPSPTRREGSNAPSSPAEEGLNAPSPLVGEGRGGGLPGASRVPAGRGNGPAGPAN